MDKLEQRLQQLETRLEAVEQQLAGQPEASPGPMTREAAERAIPAAERDRHAPLVTGRSPWRVDSIGSRQRSEPMVGSMLGWGGASALVLAASYLVRLAMEHGWLTPSRQVAIATLAGLGLIAAGLLLRGRDRLYASYLPAGGIVTLFIATYGAHLYYPLIGASTAIVAVMVICMGSLWLCRLFDSQLYAFFAVVGSYSAPFLFPPLRNSTIDLVVYFSAWSVLFSGYAILVRRRSVLLLALYLALIGFDLIWRMNGTEEWLAALLFQSAQLVIFAAGTAAFTVRRGKEMSRQAALYYLPALLIFYTLQYALLNHYLPAWAPWIALGSALLLAVVLLIARTLLKRPLPGGELLVSTYAALVLFHAGYLESVPAPWGPGVALLLLPAAALYAYWRRGGGSPDWPIYLVCLIIFILNYFRMLAGFGMAEVPGRTVLYWLYPASLYLAWFIIGRTGTLSHLQLPLLYAGHVGAMAAAVHAFDDRLMVSLSWGLLAVACLLLALRLKDRLLGQSSLLVFAASAGKLLLYDLAGAAPLIRIACLLVLGVSFYLGGWLYRRLEFSSRGND